MSAEEEYEQLRETIWDHLFQNGQQSLEDLSERLQLSVPTIVGLVDHEWFSVEDHQVIIATKDS